MLAKTTSILAIVFWMGSTTGFAFSSAQPSAGGDASSGATSSSVSGSYAGPTVWITRPDQALQCAPGTGQSLEASSEELQKAQVRILSSQKGGDHKMHAQMCGIPSGKTNTFQIPKEDLPKAVALGFHEIP